MKATQPNRSLAPAGIECPRLADANWPTLGPTPEGMLRRGGDGGWQITSLEWQAIAGALQLSSRERQVTEGVFADRKESAIAQDLAISTHTVHTHLERLYRKLGIGSRCELMVRVFAEYLRLNGRLVRPSAAQPTPAQPTCAAPAN